MCESRWVCESVCVFKRKTVCLPCPLCPQRLLLCFTWWDGIRGYSTWHSTSCQQQLHRLACVCVCVSACMCVLGMRESLCDPSGPGQLFVHSPKAPLPIGNFLGLPHTHPSQSPDSSALFASRGAPGCHPRAAGPVRRSGPPV